MLKGRPPARPGSAGAALAHVPRCDSDAGGRQVRGAAHAGADDDARGVALQRGAGRPPGVLRDAPQPGPEEAGAAAPGARARDANPAAGPAQPAALTAPPRRCAGHRRRCVQGTPPPQSTSRRLPGPHEQAPHAARPGLRDATRSRPPAHPAAPAHGMQQLRPPGAACGPHLSEAAPAPLAPRLRRSPRRRCTARRAAGGPGRRPRRPAPAARRRPSPPRGRAAAGRPPAGPVTADGRARRSPAGRSSAPVVRRGSSSKAGLEPAPKAASQGARRPPPPPSGNAWAGGAEAALGAGHLPHKMCYSQGHREAMTPA